MLLGFKKQFVQPIQGGIKIFTLRKARKNQPKIGETLYMYTGLRTNKCELISNKETLKGLQIVRLALLRFNEHTTQIVIKVDGRLLSEKEMSTFAKYDGFSGLLEFADYWITEARKTIKKTNRAGGVYVMHHWTDFRF